MNPRGVANEFTKMRRLRIGPLVAVMVVVVVALSVQGAIASPDFVTSSADSWTLLLMGLGFAVPLASPVVLAVLASRQVDIEHRGHGWLLAQTSGLTAGALCRVKFTALGATVAAATVLASGLVLGVGLLLGITAPVPIGLWLGYTAAALVISLVILALHVLLSAWVANQLVGLGIGVLGSVVAALASGLPGWFAHSIPWGYYSLVTAADYRLGGPLEMLAPSYFSVAALGVAGGVLFVIVTGLFDRQEG